MSITVSDASCDEGPPLQASFTLSLSSDECTLDGETVAGSLTASVSLSDSTLTATLSANDLVAFGVEYNFSGVTISLAGDGSLTCSGTMMVDESECTMASDCSGCTVS